MKNYPTVKLVYDRRKVATKTVPATVEICIGYEGKRTYISTGVRVTKNQWRDGAIVQRNDADILNSRIHDLLATLDDRVREMQKAGTFSLTSFKRHSTVTDEVEVFAWIEKEMSLRPIRENTRRLQLTALQVLKDSKIFATWGDFTPQNMARWTDYIKAFTGAKEQASIHNYHKRIKPYIKKALFLGYIKSDPYAGYTVPRGDSHRPKYLEVWERDALMQLELEGTAEHVRDVFIFCCYTSLAWADVAKLTRENYIEEQGYTFISSTRQKTGTPFKNVLLDVPLAIAKKYNYCIPVISNQKMNVWLKALAQMAGIHKNLTTHMARHTFGTWAVNNDIPIEVVSKLMGHRSIKETQIYAKVLQDTADAALLGLNGK